MSTPFETVSDPNAVKPTLRECQPYAIQAHVSARQSWEAIEATAKGAVGMIDDFDKSLAEDIGQFSRFAQHQPIVLTVGLTKLNKKTGEHKTVISQREQGLVYHHLNPSDVARGLLEKLPQMIRKLRPTHANKKCDKFEIKLEWFVDVRIADANDLRRGIKNLEKAKSVTNLMKNAKVDAPIPETQNTKLIIES